MSKELVKLLDEKLKTLSITESVIKEKKDIFEKSIEKEKLEKEILSKEISELKNTLNSSAVDYFNETKDKSYIGGIKIQETNVLVYDEKVATNWCLEKKMFLTFDKKSFEKAVDSLNLDFVTSKKEPKATFPKEIKLEE